MKKRKKYIYKIVYEHVRCCLNFVCEAKNDAHAIKKLYKRHIVGRVISIECIGEDGFLYKAE